MADKSAEEKLAAEERRRAIAEAKRAANAGQKKKETGGKRIEGKRKGMKIFVEPIQGTRDFYPDKMRRQRWLFDNFRAVAESFAFEEYDAPILERQELFTLKAAKGEDIKEEMFAFDLAERTDDSGPKEASEKNANEELTLRPEMTASLARMFLRRDRDLQPLKPLRWWTVAQCWRNETTTRGRKREHYQWNMDIAGVASVSAEAELLAAITTFLERVGLTMEDIVIKVGSRKLLQDVLEPLGFGGEKFGPVCAIIDKLDKKPVEEIRKSLAEEGMKDEQMDSLLKALTIQSFDDLKSLLGPQSDVVKDLNLLWEMAKGYDYADWLKFDASVVRGLSYYTGIVFEVRDRAGKHRAIAGGGRYDKLLQTYGAAVSTPFAGFGFGDVVIIKLLKDKGLLKDFSRKCDDAVIAFDESMAGAASQIAKRLRKAGRSVSVVISKKSKLPDALTTADRAGARRAVIVFPDEWAKGQVKVKDLVKQRAEVKALQERNAKNGTDEKLPEFNGDAVALDSIYSS